MNDTDAGVLGEILAADVDEDVMRALSARERRYVLYHLLEHERATLAELTDALVAKERDPGSFFGVWTYDRDRVADVSAYLRETYE